MRENCICFLHKKSSESIRWGKRMKLIVVFMMVSVGMLMAHNTTGNAYSTLKFDGQELPQAKLKVLKGVVLGQDRDTLPGVNVIIKGSTRGVVTDVHGKFVLPLPEKTDGLIICFSFIGKKPKEIKFTGQTDLKVIMEDDTQEIEEVVITGYQKIEKRHLTSSVTSLKMDDIMMPGITTVDKMLEGHVPGMIFMQNSGQVGAAPRLRIRGTSTILGTQEPLWVLDGIPLTDPVNVDPEQINDLDFVNLLGNAISGLNPNDIEQIDVLKDASATALYGTRAANGVIVITTKQGKPGPPTVSYGFTGTLTRRSRYSDRNVNVMNALERIDYSREAVEKGLSYSNISSWVGYEAALMDYYSGKLSHQEFIEKVSFYESNNTDWFDIICRDAFSHNHNLSISGGSANMKYYASLGYSRENGVLKKEQGDRYTAMMRLNLNYDKFTMSFGLSGNVLEKQYTPSEVGLMTYAYNTSRGVPAYNEDGSMWYYPYTFSGQTYPVNNNILQEREHSSQEMNSSGLSLTAQLGYKIFPSLKAEATFSYTINNSDQETYFGDKSAYAANLRGEKYDGTIVAKNNFMPFGAELRKENTKNTNYMLRGQLNYTKFLDEAQDHMITASVGGELSSTKYTGIKQTHRGYLKDRGMLISTFDAGSYPDLEKWLVSTADARGILKDQLTNSVSGYATVSYSYMNKYILNANMRIDASNKFGSRANDKLLPVWSVSARWNMKEDLMPHWTWVNTLSWRASFGYQGNMLDSESPELIIKKGDLHTQMDSYRSIIHKFPNPNLSWEKTASFNTTVDFSFFKNRVRGSFSYFYKKTKNAFLSKKISVVNGVRQYTVNQGTVENTGVELAFQLYPIPPGLGAAGGGKRGFTWRIDPQLGQVLNKLINKATENKKGDRTLHDDYTYEDYLNGNAQVAGRPLNSFFSYEFTGLNPKNGAPTFARIGEENWEQYAELTNDGVCLTVMDYSGCRVPYLQGGISNTFGYRQFTLSFNLTYSIGSKVRLMKLYDNTSSNVSAPQPVQNLRRELVDRWRKPGDEKRTNIPGILSNADYKETIDSPWWKKENSYKFGENIWQMYNNADVRVVSGNYLKLQSLSLRYSLPDDLCKKMRVSAMYLSFSTSNLFTWSTKELKGQDPASQSGSSSSISVPVLPSYTLNLNVSF